MSTTVRPGFTSILVVVSGVLVACGGSDTPPPEAGPSSAEPQAASEPSKPAEPAKSEVAAKKFEALSKQIDELAADKPVDPKWLSGELMAVVELDPNHHVARYNLAVLAERAGKRDAARKQYEKIVATAPAFAPAAENLATYLVEEGKIGEARAIYDRIMEADPQNLTSRLAAARLLLGEKQYDKAIDLCRQVLQRKADSIEAFRVLAQAYHATGNTPMAELISGRGLKVDEHDVELHKLLADILFARDDLTGAIAELKAVVAKKPDWLAVRAQLGQIALEYSDCGSASQQYEAILKEAPKDRGARVNLAVSYKCIGLIDKAEKIYKDLLAENAKDLDAIYNLAALYDGKDRFDEADKLYADYVSTAPEDDKWREGVPKRREKLQKRKDDEDSRRAKLERERKRQEAIDGTCEAIAAGKPAGSIAEGIGNEEERIGVGWQLLTTASEHMAAGDHETGERIVGCAFGVLPDTPNAKVNACAPMKVMWTRDILYPLGRLDDAIATIEAALVCDPESPEGQLIREQLVQLKAAQAAEAAAGAAGGEGAPGGEAAPGAEGDPGAPDAGGEAAPEGAGGGLR